MKPLKPNRQLQRFLSKWPGEKYFGVYRFLPIFFFLGAALEFSMIHWKVGETNFYSVYKRRQVEELIAKAQVKNPQE